MTPLPHAATATRFMALAAAALLTSGCATIYAGRYPWSEGWRDGKVVQVLPGAEAPHAGSHPCLKGMTPQERSRGQVVELAYRQGRTKRSWMPLPPGMALRAGDGVYFNPYRCAPEIVRH